MTIHAERLVPAVGSLLLAATIIGCASQREAERAAAQTQPAAAALIQARASITEAEQAGAIEFGAPQLALAREKLRAADEATADGDAERAHRLAVEADLDADLAIAITRHRETQQLVAEVREGLRTLEQESQRETERGLLLQP